MGRLGLGYTINAVLDDLRDKEERLINTDTRKDKNEKQEALTALDNKIRRYKKDFARNINDVFPPDVKRNMKSDVLETKRGR